MSVVLVRFGWIFLLTNSSAVELSAWIRVLVCLCPYSLRIMHMYADSLADM